MVPGIAPCSFQNRLTRGLGIVLQSFFVISAGQQNKEPPSKSLLCSALPGLPSSDLGTRASFCSFLRLSMGMLSKKWIRWDYFAVFVSWAQPVVFFLPFLILMSFLQSMKRNSIAIFISIFGCIPGSFGFSHQDPLGLFPVWNLLRCSSLVWIYSFM